MHPLPARPTGRAGVETSAIDHSENDAFDARSYAEHSTTDLVEPAPVPYSLAAPDLPPQPYHDEPAVYGANYSQQGDAYDPYRGPVPRSLTSPEDPYGRRTSGAYDVSQAASGTVGARRTPSPGPQAVYAGRAPSPGPQAAYAGRTPSPGPQNAFGFGIPRTTSPGAYAAYESQYGGADQHAGQQQPQL